ncbi:MAG TPA: sigma-70 family RNA polymerase sigma factor [Cyclobacteriaceae bacterium]|nr:sigma-70 family RNA polymerase sigma factor [Cyclobacteriaceae bacterium]
MKISKKSETLLSNEHNPIESKEETQLWIEFLQGNDVALAEIYHRYAPKLFNYGRQFTGNITLIQDAIQDTFFKLVDNKRKLNIAQSVKFYLYATFRRILLRSIKKEEKYVGKDYWQENGFQIMVDPDFFVLDGHWTEVQKKLLQNTCNALPARQREIVTLRFFENMEYGEIADLMGLANAKTVRTMLYRGLKTMAEALNKAKKTFLF